MYITFEGQKSPNFHLIYSLPAVLAVAVAAAETLLCGKQNSWQAY